MLSGHPVFLFVEEDLDPTHRDSPDGVAQKRPRRRQKPHSSRASPSLRDAAGDAPTQIDAIVILFVAPQPVAQQPRSDLARSLPSAETPGRLLISACAAPAL
ncbi:MAG: hypothetical protein DI537_39275 [Stutzerimonas stutzeri]|nr:MAG: hypothetical protein DI537_39275 [Stutzerimonas stutzeri]